MELMMPALLTDTRALDVHRSFWDFVASRPDEEKWELIAGRFVMQAQPNFNHQLIAGNLERLLTDGLDRLDLDQVAMQNPAVDLRPTIDGHTYVPDVAVLDAADIEPNRNVTPNCYLAAEIISRSDRRKPSGTNREKIAIKLEGYETLPTCEAVLLIEQKAFDVTLAIREAGAWVTHRLTDPEDRLRLASAGLDCRVIDLYARTSLARASKAP